MATTKGARWPAEIAALALRVEELERQVAELKAASHQHRAKKTPDE